MNTQLLSTEIRRDEDVVLVRQRARQIAKTLGLNQPQQTAFATAVSEIARNAMRYAGGGKVEFSLTNQMPNPKLGVRIADRGKGIPHLDRVLSGQYQSTTGMGIGIIGSKRLCDEFEITTEIDRGTTVTLAVRVPGRGVITSQMIAELTSQLALGVPDRAMDEVHLQNRELLMAIESLQTRQQEVERLNAELAETNRGVLALYAELDERAESLRRASEYKTRFLSDMTHELRTPLNGMISLARLLLDRVDGELTPEQEKQVQLIFKSANSLSDIVNDLLDLAKIEAGKTTVCLSQFGLNDVLSALRGVFRPVVASSAVDFIVDEPCESLQMYSDELKLTQILRNLASNAVKYTERGEVRVMVQAIDDARAAFTVSDTGIGIAAEHLETIFSDFGQIDSPLQRRVRGTGLGLPLTRKLARLLGGEVGVSSVVGQGSTFKVILPLNCPRHTEDESDEQPVNPGQERSIA